MFALNKIVIGGIILFCTLALLVPKLINAAEPLKIQIKDRTMVDGDKIYLEDIASFMPIDDSRIDSMKGLEVASAPSPGNSFKLRKAFLDYKINSNLTQYEDVKLEIPRDLIVERNAQKFEGERMKEIFREYILDNLPESEDRISIKRISRPEDIYLPTGRLSWEVIERNRRNLTGNVSIAISFSVDERMVRKVNVSGKVLVTREIVKARRPVKSGEILSREDLEMARETREKFASNVMTDLYEVIGKKALRSMRPGLVITSRMIDDQPMVKRGKRVIIIAERDSIRVTAAGKVLEDGKAGDQVRVINVSSGKEIITTVKGPGQVEVYF